jgi:hypothetical protein
VGQLTRVRRFGAIAVLTSALLQASSLSVAAAEPQQWVVGAGSRVTEDGGQEYLAIAAQRVPVGFGGRGHFELFGKDASGQVVTRIHVTVVCVNIFDNIAQAGGLAEGVYQGFPRSGYLVVRVVDNQPDQFGVDPDPESCSDFGRLTSPVDRGNFIVRS